ncbi:MAG: 1-deoxy-D-xylulose-5-phosphate synthase [Firmicutes bacterium]|jgi:1-deoxy-D-xylulose-5-phosphate synthase|nr:1-deoxy-D-xylulose-5-phosphate synthase [Bacillota bacterium]
MLERLKPGEIKKCTRSELNVLCDELRNVIYETVTTCGGHLASNLGAVEPTVALFYVFDFPKDKIIFDVGHQCYAYKLLSGRRDKFPTLRKEGGLSGFPKRKESEYDCYDTGHAGTSVSAALGIAKARDLQGEDYNVIAFIGDGSFNNGLIYEALNSLRILNTKILIVLNDNGMSISPTVGGMHDILVQLKAGNKEENVRLLEKFGLTYLGVRNGNDAEEMIDSLAEAKKLLKTQSVLLHIVTKKGKGYEFSEEHPTNTHGIAPVGARKEKEYSEVLGTTLCDLAREDGRITAVTAAMTGSLGLNKFFAIYPERAFDVGICEENASVLCAAMASAGLKPYYAIYSTFLQRAFDEIIHDVCAQDLPVTFCVDRSGISGADGETHQGVFDLSYLSLIPGLTIAVPKDTEEFKEFLRFSARFAHPLAIRYPRSGKIVFPATNAPIEAGKWEYLHKSGAENGSPVTVIAAGERCLIIAMKIWKNLNEKGLDFDVVNARFVKPLDRELLAGMESGTIVTVEDNVSIGGLGQRIDAALRDCERETGKKFTVRNFAYRDEFIPQGNVGDLQREYGVSCEEIENYISESFR